MASKSKTLNDLFLHTLKGVYYAERHAGKILSKLAKATETEDLSQAFEQHRDETHTQVERLEQVFDLLGKKAERVPCEAIQGLIEEAKLIIDDFKGSDALDAGLIASAQAIEHYEIARYGALKAWASELGLNQAATLLEETLAEEKKATSGSPRWLPRLTGSAPTSSSLPTSGRCPPPDPAAIRAERPFQYATGRLPSRP